MKYQIAPKQSFQNGTCRIGYRNLLEQGLVTATSENASFPVANCYDWLTHDFFRPAAAGTVHIELTLQRGQPASYFAFYAQDLWKYGGTIKLQYHNGSTYVDCTPTIAPSSNAPRAFFFDTLWSNKWRVVISCSNVFNIGVIAFGEHLAVPRGMYMSWTPPVFGRANETINSVSDAGSFLGRSLVSKGIETSLSVTHATDDWMRKHWLNFVRHAEQKPFFFVPDLLRNPNDVALCWTGSNIPAPAHSAYKFMSVSIPLKGVIE